MKSWLCIILYIFIYISLFYGKIIMHITIIDDEKILIEKISKKLKYHWHLVDAFYSFSDFMFHGLNINISDLYIIDISLNDWSGLDILDILRNHKKLNTRIIIISAFWDIQKKLLWFNLWADDYITKPFLPDELLARIKAIFRRTDNFTTPQESLIHNNIILNRESKEVFVSGRKVNLSKTEYIITKFFIKNSKRIIPKKELIQTIWGHQFIDEISDNNINVTLYKLKKKLGDNFSLKTKYNQWYILS